MPNSIKRAPVILAFEGSTKHLSVAVYMNGSVQAMQKIEAAFGQAAELVPLAIRTLADAGIEFANLSHVAAGCGPGSFTGLRVSLAAAKGVCLAHNLPGLGISGLEALAFFSSKDLKGSSVLCLADTRRGNVYAQIFASDVTPQSPIFETQIDQLPILVPTSICVGGLILAGFGGLAAAEAFAANGLVATPYTIGGKRNAVIVDAGMIATLAATKILRSDYQPLTPIYLADPRLGPKKKKPVT